MWIFVDVYEAGPATQMIVESGKEFLIWLIGSCGPVWVIDDTLKISNKKKCVCIYRTMSLLLLPTHLAGDVQFVGTVVLLEILQNTRIRCLLAKTDVDNDSQDDHNRCRSPNAVHFTWRCPGLVRFQAQCDWIVDTINKYASAVDKCFVLKLRSIWKGVIDKGPTQSVPFVYNR